MPSMRLHKFIGNCGCVSRRHAELLIQGGRVRVNGRLVSSPGTSVDPEKDSVAINGEMIHLPEPLTIVFHKPMGLITSTHDTHERLTVMDYLPMSLKEKGLVPAGRLDQDTEGLLVLTNVGDLNHRITHPRYETEKEYTATVSERPSRGALERLERGIILDGSRTAPARIVGVKATDGGIEVGIAIHEGRKRQVRRMLQAVGHEVLRLSRVRIGRFELGDLPLGEWRELRAEEIEALTETKPGPRETGSGETAGGRGGS